MPEQIDAGLPTASGCRLPQKALAAAAEAAAGRGERREGGREGKGRGRGAPSRRRSRCTHTHLMRDRGARRARCFYLALHLR